MNIHITPTAEGAKGTCYMVGQGRPSPKSPVIKGLNPALYVDGPMPGFYSDTLVKTSAGWRFKTRAFWTAYELAQDAGVIHKQPRR
jgi:hypothetical protein